MPRRALDNPLVLAVLGLLLEGPSHPYQMLADLQKRGSSRLNRGTLYDIVDAVAAAGWIAPEDRSRAGNRPERTVYAVTPSGLTELRRRLDEQIRTPEREFSRFLGAVSYLGALGAEGAADALTERAERLSSRIAADREVLTSIVSSGVARLHMIEGEYALAVAQAELDWVTTVVAEIRAGELTWP
ncbi:PadR family transcriptional regulator [Actinosynnema sp. NPDC020468]|uniref:PadR family transcriptional regulator n=1 Tax=Actinosynnema sp. NPDC020468 TaxID=3154488 RepID=UPI00340120FD